MEEDFLSADLSLVPAHKAQDVGLDRSMLGAYGQDDRVCAYTSLQATLENEQPEYTVVTIFGDKEETGSDSNTGMNSDFAATSSPIWLRLRRAGPAGAQPFQSAFRPM